MVTPEKLGQVLNFLIYFSSLQEQIEPKEKVLVGVLFFWWLAPIGSRQMLSALYSDGIPGHCSGYPNEEDCGKIAHCDTVSDESQKDSSTGQ